MIEVRPAAARGHANHGWLDTWHSFSFARYYDPRHMGFRSLRVINDDRVAGGGGVPTHPHNDMEIVTVVLEGALEHRDSMGNGSVLRRGDVQRMSAGTGLTHSEFNPSDDEPLRLLQIWLLPEREGLPPSWEEKRFPVEEQATPKLRLVAQQPSHGELAIHQDVDLYRLVLRPGESATHTLSPGRHAWLQVAEGEVTINGQQLAEGDGAAVSDETELNLSGDGLALLFDLA